jgi:cytochrome b
MTSPNLGKPLEHPLAQVQVWDLPTRIFHWSVAGLVGLSWYSAHAGHMRAHLWSGLILLTLLLFRITWGLLGSTTSRFSDFVAGPASVVSYLKALATGRKQLYAGHNPAGGWMVVAMILTLAMQVTTGLFANDGLRFNGPLAILVSTDESDRLTQLHGALFNLLLLFVWLHTVAVLFYLCVRGEDLIRPMVTGKKPPALLPTGLQLKFTPLPFALLLAAPAIGFAWWLIQS